LFQGVLNMVKPRLSLSVQSNPSAVDLLFARQLGVDCVYTWVREGQNNYAFLDSLRQRVEDEGLTLYNVGFMGVAKSDKIHLALPGRDEVIAQFQEFITELGRAGIFVTTFTWEPTQVWSSEPGECRGAVARQVDLQEMLQRPFTHGREYSEAEIWDNFSYFMERILPVAEQAGVRLALHPNDPPAPKYGGIPSLIHSFDSYKRAFAIADSYYLGMEFCTGCWLEGGDEGFGNVLEGIRTLTEQDKILLVHFRNVSAPLPVFIETFLDNGYMDMYQIMKTLYEGGYGNTVTLDHTPKFVGDYAKGAGPAYAIGYMKALMQRAEAELGM
jgi:mannonate dehydratase